MPGEGDVAGDADCSAVETVRHPACTESRSECGQPGPRTSLPFGSRAAVASGGVGGEVGVARTFAPGFRLSRTDVITLFVGGVGGAACMLIDANLAVGVWFVVAHFFAFCNVLRMRRWLELTWAGAFVLLVLASVQFDLLAWPVAFGGSLAVTLVCTTIELRSPSYHGAGWRALNPGLVDWWQANQKKSSR